MGQEGGDDRGADPERAFDGGEERAGSPRGADGSAGPILGGHLDRIRIDHPRHADLKIVLSAIGPRQKEALKAHVI